MTPGGTEGWTALVERDGELDLIDHALSGAFHGRGRFVLLYGPAGIGRSSIVRAAAFDAEARGLVVLEACGSDLERGYGFGVVRQLLEARLAGLTSAQRRSALDDAGPAVVAALGLGHSEIPLAGASFDQIEGVYRIVARLAATQPLLVAVDDLQWCDRPSLDFLCFLGHRATRLPVTIVAAWRRGEPGVRAGRLQALAGNPDTVFLTLAPLSGDGVRAALRLHGGEGPDDDVVETVRAVTGGQPFLVNELGAGLRLRGIPMTTGHCEAIEAVTPESVRRDIVARLGRYSEAVQHVAHAVAVLGNAPLAVVGELAGLELDKAHSCAAALVRAGVLEDDSTLTYTQPLVRAAVYDTLTSLERDELHRRAARLLWPETASSDPADLERVAQHLLRCDPIEDPRFGDVLRVAALRALGRGAPTDARRLLERALGEITDPADRGEMLTRLAEIELRTGDIDAAGVHAAKARRLVSRTDDKLAAILAAAHAAAAAQGCEAAVELIEREVFQLGGAEAEAEAKLRAAAAVLRACDHEAPWATARATTAVEQLPGQASHERASLAACASHMVLTGSGTAARVAHAGRRALAGTTALIPSESSAPADYLARRSAVLAGFADVAEASDSGDVFALALRAQLALSRGLLADAHAETQAALALLVGASPMAFHRRVRDDLLATSVVTSLETSRCDAAEEALKQLLDTDRPHPAAGPLRIAVALARSRVADAVAASSPVDEKPMGPCAPGVYWRPWAALAHHAAEDDVRAVTLATAHVQHARLWAAPSSLGHALIVRGVVDPGAERLAHLEEAVTVLEQTSAQLEHARARIELGAALRRARRRSEARDQLARGADLAHRCGADALAARARAELVSVGARPRRAAFSGVAALTASELRVAQLAASGMTNREIASELIVSAKTVSGQLTAVYRKLDIHDRAALAAAMQNELDAGRPSVDA